MDIYYHLSPRATCITNMNSVTFDCAHEQLLHLHGQLTGQGLSASKIIMMELNSLATLSESTVT